MPRLNLNHPAPRLANTRADRCVPSSLALQKKRGPVSHLRNRSIHSKIPHRRRDQVLPRLQQRCQVESLVAPVRQIAARGPVPSPMPVHKKDEPIVRTHPDNIGSRNSRQRQVPPKMQNNRLTQRRGRMCNPRCLPLPVRSVRLILVLCLDTGRGKSNGKNSKNCAHKVEPSF